jgi:hypothetical protein
MVDFAMTCDAPIDEVIVVRTGIASVVAGVADIAVPADVVVGVTVLAVAIVRDNVVLVAHAGVLVHGAHGDHPRVVEPRVRAHGNVEERRAQRGQHHAEGDPERSLKAPRALGNDGEDVEHEHGPNPAQRRGHGHRRGQVARRKPLDAHGVLRNVCGLAPDPEQEPPRQEQRVGPVGRAERHDRGSDALDKDQDHGARRDSDPHEEQTPERRQNDVWHRIQRVREPCGRIKSAKE